MLTPEDHAAEGAASFPIPVRLGLLALGGIGATLIWQWWGFPRLGVAILSTAIGAFLIALSVWGLALSGAE